MLTKSQMNTSQSNIPWRTLRSRMGLTLLQANEMKAAVHRERMRADRARDGFSVLALNLPRQASADAIDRLRSILSVRLRSTDVTGRLPSSRIGIVLPNTPAAGAWKLADDLGALLPESMRREGCEVYEYLSDIEEGEPARRADRRARPMHELLAGRPPLWKRALDLLGAGAALVAVAPVMLAVALLIKWQSPGPVFYQQERIGRFRRRFKVWKFRTMVCNADSILEEYLAACPQRRAEWERDHKLKDDPRITSIGQWLRKTSLDELPQLINVLRGEMSLVGPRPIVTAEVSRYSSKFAPYCSVLPGITGLWQVSGRNDTTYGERVELDSYYARNASLWLDLRILFKTVGVVLRRQGAY